VNAPRRVTIPYAPRIQQATVHADPHRFKVLVTHRRFGKTVLAVNELVKQASMCRRPQPRYAYMAPYLVQAKDIAWSYLKHYTAPIPDVMVNEAETWIELPGERRIRLYGADNADRLRGLYFDGVVMDEPAQMAPRVWAEIIRPALSDRLGWAMFIGTPMGRNAFCDLYEMGLSGADPDWAAFMFKASETGIIPAAELDATRRAMTSDQYAQEFECFKPDAIVTCADRAKPIAEVVQGDIVLTHTGRLRRVSRVFSKPYVGQMVRVQSYGSPPLVCTPEHPIYTCDPDKQTYAWKPARELAEGDWLVSPKAHVGKPIIPAELARVIGWYIAEGSVSGNRLTFSLGHDEQAEASALRADLATLGFRSDETRIASVISIGVNDVGLADFLVGNCGGRQENRRLPLGLIRGNERETWAALIAGDGGRYAGARQGWSEVVMYTTISRELIYQVHALAATMGYTGSITTRPAHDMAINGREYVAAESYALQMRRGKGDGAKTRSARHAVLGRVRSVTTETYAGTVHNLRVDGDESYLVSGRAVHNCSFDAAIPGAYYAELLASIEHMGRIKPVAYEPNLPVHTAWDLGINDPTAIWFFQMAYGEPRILDYYEIRRRRWNTISANCAPDIAPQWVYGMHLMPHDANVKELQTGMTRVQALKNLGVHVTVLPMLGVDDGISQARFVMRKCWFNSERCGTALKLLRQYRSEWDDKRQVLKPVPLHDFTSHCADAFRYLSVGVTKYLMQGMPLADASLSGHTRAMGSLPRQASSMGGAKPFGWRK
jgi:hypothetical protein